MREGSEKPESEKPGRVEIRDGKRVRIVEEENLPAKNLAVGIFALPLMFLVSTAFAIPFVLFNAFTIVPAVLTTVATELVLVWWGLRYVKEHKNWKSALRLDGFSWRNLLLGAGIGTLLWIALQVIVYSVLAPLGLNVESSDTSTSLTSLTGWSRYIVLFAFAPIIIPFVEEVFFRGYIMGMVQRGIKNKRAGAVWAVIISTVAFGVAHVQGWSTATDLFIVLWTAAIAAINAILVLRTKTIWTSFAVHLAYNGITVILSTII